MLTPGGMFGDYRVIERLGKGGMGEVWRVEIESRRQPFAVKILDPALAAQDREFRKRFVREAEIAMAVRHPNLVRVYDVGEDPDSGLCYIIMQYVGGGSLSDRIAADGPLPTDEALDIVAQLAGVLETARLDGVVHRDIKSENILFSTEGVPMLTDLGIARCRFAASATTVTKTGFMLGTPAYMAPEQMLDSHNVDCRADIYSLGIVLFEMLTGRRPNEGVTTMQLLKKAATGEPIPDVRTVAPGVPGPVAKLIARMCEIEVDKRLATPAAVAEAVTAIRAGEDPFSPRPTRRTLSCRRRKLRRIILAAAVAAVAVIVADFAVYWFLLRKPPAETGKSVQEEEMDLYYIPGEG